MKKFALFLAGTLFCIFYFTNSPWFQSLFFSKDFYQNIYSASFDVLTKGNSITIPINKYAYSTCYDLSLAVPEDDLAHNWQKGNGRLSYSFESGGEVLHEGTTNPPDGKHRRLYNETSSVSLLVFDLPFPKADNDLVLNLIVLEPMTFLNKYSGDITVQINPDYSGKLNGCYNEELRIDSH